MGMATKGPEIWKSRFGELAVRLRSFNDCGRITGYTEVIVVIRRVVLKQWLFSAYERNTG
jgi:hypothetical protein